MRDYQAFPRWVCENVLDLDNSATDDAVIDGAGDYGIDIVHIEDNSYKLDQYVCIGQVKFNKNLDYNATEQDVNSLIHAWRYLEDCPDDANEAFKQKAQEYKAIKKNNPNIQKITLFAVAGSLNRPAKTLVAKTRSESLPNDHNKDPQLRILERDEIFSRIVTPHTPPIRIAFDGDLIERSDPITQRPSIVGYVNAKSLVDAIKPYRGSIFLENPRDYIGGASTTNRQIEKTLCDEKQRKKFWKFNNGITAICDQIKEIEVPDHHEFRLTNFKVVNGRQTTSVLEKNIGEIEDVFVSLIIHEAVDTEEHNQISQATNTQNPIKPIDMITNFSELHTLELECKQHFKEFFFERQTYGFKFKNLNLKKCITSRRVLEKNSTARAYYAYSKNPNDAMKSDRDFFLSNDSICYDAVFKQPLRNLIISHIFMKTLEELCSDWRKKSKDIQISESERDMHKRNAQIFGKRIVRYYVIHFVRLSMDRINEEKRIIIENKMIEIIRNLEKKDKIPEMLTNVLETTCHSFILWFNTRSRDTYPSDVVERMNEPGSPKYTPTPYDIAYKLKKYGSNILPILVDCMHELIGVHKEDKIKEYLEVIA